MTKPIQPTPKELLSHHLAYEIDQMVASLVMLGQVKVPEEWSSPERNWQKDLDNALMESFYIHARALFEFFPHRRGARKYTKANYEPFKGVAIKGWVSKLNNQVAHLMDGRTADDNLKINGQDRVDMINALATEVNIFKASLKSEFASIVIPIIPKFSLQAARPNATNHVWST